MEDTNNYYPLQSRGYREDYAITLQGEIVETANNQPIRKGKGERYKNSLPPTEKAYTEQLNRFIGVLLARSIRQTSLKIQMVRNGSLSTAEESITSATEGELRASRESEHGY